MRGEPGLFDIDERLKRLEGLGDPLLGFARVVDFEIFRPELEKALAYASGTEGGRPPLDCVMMFKVLVVQASNNLSDDRTEFLINDRLSFMRFLGLTLADKAPDAKTIWAFRERLTRAGAIEGLFKRFDAHVKASGYLAPSGQIVDASLIAAPKQRNTQEEKRAIKEGRIPEGWNEKPAKPRQKDRDARWTVKMLWGERRRRGIFGASNNPMECPMPQSNDLSRSLAALNQDSTIVVVIEISQSSWLVRGMLPGVTRQPLKKLAPDEAGLLKLLHRWRSEAIRTGQEIARTVVAYEAGRDGFWLARWLLARDIEAYVIHPSSVAVSREHRRVKTDRLDTELLMRAFLGWLRGERRHCSMVAIPTIEEEDVRRPNRERKNLVTEQTRIVNQVKAIFARFGIRTLRPTQRKVEDRLEGVRTAEGTLLPDARGA